jgi:transposase
VRLYRRLLAVLERDRGTTVSAVAQLLGVSCRRVYNCITRMQHGGDGCAYCAPISPARAGEVINVLLQSLLILSPEWFGYYITHWTVPPLKNRLRQNTREQYASDTRRSRPHRLGYVWKRPATFSHLIRSETTNTKFAPPCLVCPGAALCWL